MNYAERAPPEVSEQMVKEALKSMKEVASKEEKRQAQKGQRLLLRLDAKGIYPAIAKGVQALIHRHIPVVEGSNRSKRRMISLDSRRPSAFTPYMPMPMNLLSQKRI